MTRLVTIDVPDGPLPAKVQGPDDASAVPALVVVPSIFGPAADLLEGLRELGDGALVVAPDPFWRTGEGVVPYDDRDTAFGRLADFDFSRCGQEMAAALAWAKERSNGKAVGLGVCFGGPYVLRMAADGGLDGVVTWHGSRMEQALDGADRITCPVRLHFGSADPITPPEVIARIHAAFASHPDAQVIVHDDATHGFSHGGDAFDELAHRESLASVVELVERLR